LLLLPVRDAGRHRLAAGPAAGAARHRRTPVPAELPGRRLESHLVAGRRGAFLHRHGPAGLAADPPPHGQPIPWPGCCARLSRWRGARRPARQHAGALRKPDTRLPDAPARGRPRLWSLAILLVSLPSGPLRRPAEAAPLLAVPGRVGLSL